MIHSVTRLDPEIAAAVDQFSVYSDEIESIIHANHQEDNLDLMGDVVPSILNGKTSQALQTLIPLGVRKKAGLFFTSDRIARKVADQVGSVLQANTRIIDPACGAGNLLLACATSLPLGSDLKETLSNWTRRLFGYDLYPEFIRAAKLRLMLLAISMHPEETDSVASLRPRDLFKEVKVGNVFDHLPISPSACVVVNPPFGNIHSPVDCKWTTGKAQIAALFIEGLLRSAPEGQHIVAILPDVLRSGTRYRRWRETISSLCTTIAIEPAGRFDSHTDIDVFVLHVRAGKTNISPGLWVSSTTDSDNILPTLSDYFHVHVGPVVPHRDLLQGPSYPYIHARTARAWQIVDHLYEERQYSGAVFSPPFVVVRRTSSPRDRYRCVATIVDEQHKVAVENHLLVLLPLDKSIQSCKNLLKVLKTKYTNDWFNKRIRCRHITVSAMRELPLDFSCQNRE